MRFRSVVVHARGTAFTEVTHRLRALGFRARCRYEWLDDGRLRATVLESNVLRSGSTWETDAIDVARNVRGGSCP